MEGPERSAKPELYPYYPGDGCYGCGRVDPCGYHYEDCTLLEPGDGLVERGTERVIGYVGEEDPGPGWPGEKPEGMDWGEWYAFNNID